jgi:hypothetical protein
MLHGILQLVEGLGLNLSQFLQGLVVGETGGQVAPEISGKMFHSPNRGLQFE